MKEERLSMRQLLALLFTGLLAAALRQLPGRSADLAQDAGAWLSAVIALPAALLLCWAAVSIQKGLPDGWGYGEALCGVLGPVPGRALTILYMVWTILVLGSALSQSGERLKVMGYSGWGQAVFLAFALLLALRMALGRIDAFARAVEVFFLILTAALVFVVLLAAFRVEPADLTPMDPKGALRGALPALELACAGLPAAFLAGKVKLSQGERAGRKLLRWTAWGAVALTAVQAVCVGAFGWQVTARQRLPLFEAAKQAGVPGAFQRVEAVVAALLVMSDVALFGLSLAVLRAQGRALSRKLTAPKVAPAAAAAGAAVAFAMTRSRMFARFLGEFLLPALALVLGFGVPLVVVLVKMLRARSGRMVISCGGPLPKPEDIVAEKKDVKSAKKKQKRC